MKEKKEFPQKPNEWKKFKRKEKSLITTICLTTLLSFSSPAKWFDYDLGDNWKNQNNITNEEISKNSKEKEIILKEKEKALKKLENTNDYREKKQILEYIKYLNELSEDQNENISRIEITKEYPKHIFVEIINWVKEYNEVKTWGSRKPRERDTENESEKLDKAVLQTNQINKWEQIKWKLVFNNYPEDINLKYNWNQLIVSINKQKFHIPILEDNKNKKIKLNFDNDWWCIILKLNRR